MKSENVVRLIQAHMAGDHTRFKELAEMIASDAPVGVATSIRRLLYSTHQAQPVMKLDSGWTPVPVNDKTRLGLLDVVWPEEESILDPELNQVVQRFQTLVSRSHEDTARKLGLKPRLLLHGMPGVGKTTAAIEVARRLELPIFITKVSNIVSSYLGETLKHITAVFESMKEKQAILFLDELDAMGSRRGESSDAAEMGRASVAFIQALDSLPYTCPVVAATNRLDRVDSAVVRRFVLRAEVGLPAREAVINWFNNMLGYVPEFKDGVTWSDVHDTAVRAWIEQG